MTDEELLKRLSEDNSHLKATIWELKNDQNNKGWKLQVEIYKDKYLKIKEANEVLAARIKTLREKLSAKQPVEGSVVLITNTHELGRYVSQNTHLQVLQERNEYKEKIKQYETGEENTTK
jgi:hypothetical protein